MRAALLFLLFFCTKSALSQLNVGVFAGGASYLGELNDDVYRRTKPAGGLTLGYEFNDRFALRGGLMIGKLEGADKYGQTQAVKETRNLSFETSLTEFSLLGEVNLFDLSHLRLTPYVFAGIAVFHFNPFTRDSGRKVFLQPLGTEGQGAAGGPGQSYTLTQLAIPFGGGLRYAINDNVRLGLEVGLRRLFTDYLDDVSTNYPDAAALYATRGPQAVRFSYRGGEIAGGNDAYPDLGFPSKGTQRGNAKTKDWYYFTGLHLTFRLPSGGSTRYSRNSNKYGCPSVPL